jgi:hypothetical protein
MTSLVYLDQSERAMMLSRYYGLVTAVTMLLLGAGVATPIACLDAQPATARSRGAAAPSRDS